MPNVMEQTELAQDGTRRSSRTQESRLFESMWRNLQRESLLPRRSSFHPERAGRLLSNIVLLEINPGKAPDGKDMTTRIRLIGSALRDLAEINITGLDYLDLVPDREYQTRHLMTCMTRPCASWSLSPVVYDRGYSSLVEITNFPLIDDATEKHLSLVLMIEIKNDLLLRQSTGRPLEMRPATEKAFIDIGAGVPEEEAL